MTTVEGADTTTLDARGLHCPLPVIELAKAVEEVDVGEEVVVLADDPSTRIDIPVWCRMRRHDLVDVTEDDGHVRYRVRRAA